MASRVFGFEEKGAQQVFENIRAHRTEIEPLASSSALNRTATQMRTQAVRVISKASGIRQKDVRRQVVIETSTPFTLEVTIKARGRAINLIEFVAPSKKRTHAFRTTRGGKLRRGSGVVAKAWGQRKEYPGTFIAPGKNSGKLLVYVRDPSKPSGIRGAYGPRVPKEFIEETVTRLMDSVAQSVFQTNLEREFNFRLGRITR